MSIELSSFLINITSKVILDLGLGWWELGAKSLSFKRTTMATLFDFPRKGKSCHSLRGSYKEYSVDRFVRIKRFSK